MIVPMQTTLYLALGALLCLVGPVLFLILHCRKHGCGAWPALAGAAAFVVSYNIASLVAVEVARVPGFARLLSSSAVEYAVFYALLSGVFEETARLAVLGLMRRHRGWRAEAAVAYGAGHGGFEAMLVLGFSYTATLVFVLYAAATGLADASAAFGVSAGSVEALLAPPPHYYLAALVERAAAMALHAANTSLIWLALRRGVRWLFPAAIATHALVNLGVACYRYGAVTSVWAVECYTAVTAAAVCLLAWRLWGLASR